MAKPRVALLGLGTMGGGMAGRLLSGGFPLAVYNRSRERAASLASAGAQVASSPAEAATGADVIISMVADDRASREVLLGDNGALAAAKRGAVLIECSTLSVGWVKELAAAVGRQGCDFLDAPVTGTKPHAASGELLFMVGGDAGVLDRVRPVLAVMARDVIHLGPVGSGATMKLINNFICGVQAASFAEGFAMIRASGLDSARAISILTDGAPGSMIVKRVATRVGSADGDVNFRLRLMAKDLGYAVSEASSEGIDLRTASSALQVFQQAIAHGHGDEDFSAITKAFQ